MRVLLATPTARPATTGNAATAERWASGLRARGHGCTVFATLEASAGDFARALEAASPDVVVLHHAVHSGRFVDQARARAAVVVSFAGTDLAPEALQDVARHAAERASLLVAGGEDPGVVAGCLPAALGPRIRTVPKGVVLGDEPFPLRARIGAASSDLVVLLPAGVRPVKATRFPVEPLERLRARGLAVRYVVLGPVLDAPEGEALAADFTTRPWCARLEANPGAVPAALRAADLVLNCSRIEGFSNAVAEALACGCAVLASDNPGNRAALGSAGRTYAVGDARDFEIQAEALLRDAGLRAALGATARAGAAIRFDPAREIDSLVAVLEEAVAARTA